MTFTTALPGTILVAGPQPAQTGDDKGTAMMDKALKETNLTYKRSASGKSFELEFDHGASGKRKIYVSSVYNKVDTMLAHVIYSTVWAGKEAPSEKILLSVFSQSKNSDTFTYSRTLPESMEFALGRILMHQNLDHHLRRMTRALRTSKTQFTSLIR
jgi:hypothetical protein